MSISKKASPAELINLYADCGKTAASYAALSADDPFFLERLLNDVQWHFDQIKAVVADMEHNAREERP